MLTAKTIQRYNKKNLHELIKLAEKHFNRYIRERDKSKEMPGYFRCISCNMNKDIHLMNAGHYLSAGHNGSVRFDENNVHGQCIQCNMHLHGNLLNYRTGLIRKIGLSAVEVLEIKSKMRGFKWDRWALVEVIERYKSIKV